MDGLRFIPRKLQWVLVHDVIGRVRSDRLPGAPRVRLSQTGPTVSHFRPCSSRTVS